jgi:tetratricopeptide (TPR) repeat protein
MQMRLLRRVREEIVLKNWASARSLLAKCTSKEVEWYILSLELLCELKDWENALPLADEALAQHGDQLQLHLKKGHILMALDRPQEAIDHFVRAEPIQQDESDRLAHARALFQCGQFNLAWIGLEPFIQSSRSGPLLALAADCLFAQRRYQQALLYYEKAAEQGIDNHQLMARHGHCLLRVGRLDEAEVLLRSILEVDESHLLATLSLGSCLEDQERYQEALEIYQNQTIWQLNDARILRQSGICAFYLGEYQYAELYLQEATRRGSQPRKSLAFLGYALECQQRWEEAEKVYHQLIQDHPDYVVGYRGLAWLYGVGISQAIDAETGLLYAKRCVEILPDTSSWEVLSACEARAGNFSEAHQIQENLSRNEADRATRQRRLRAMRALRQKLPLNEEFVARTLVA